MALAEPDDETAMGTQVLGPEKSRVLSILGPGLITGCAYRKSNPDIFVMQSAENLAAKNTPFPLYGAR